MIFLSVGVKFDPEQRRDLFISCQLAYFAKVSYKNDFCFSNNFIMFFQIKVKNIQQIFSWVNSSSFDSQINFLGLHSMFKWMSTTNSRMSKMGYSENKTTQIPTVTFKVVTLLKNRFPLGFEPYVARLECKYRFMTWWFCLCGTFHGHDQKKERLLSIKFCTVKKVIYFIN